VFFDGSVVVSSHFEPGPVDHSRIYYLDRVDVSNPAAPEVLPSLNIPGEVLAFDSKLGRAAVFRPDLISGSASAGECFGLGTSACIDPATDECRALRGSIWLVAVEDGQVGVLDSYELEPFEVVAESLRVGERLIVRASQAYTYTERLLVFDGLSGSAWKPTASFSSSCGSLLANAEYVATSCDYPTGCGPQVFALSGTAPNLDALTTPLCGSCTQALALAGARLVTVQSDTGVRVLPLN